MNDSQYRIFCPEYFGLGVPLIRGFCNEDTMPKTHQNMHKKYQKSSAIK
jgi:hypothetical protein